MFSDIQLAAATSSTAIWLHNACRLLSRPLLRTPDDTRWWRLVRIIHAEVGLPLRASAKIADSALRPGLTSGRIRLNATRDGAVAMVLDLERLLSTASAAIGSARTFSVPPRRGRPPGRPSTAHISPQTIPNPVSATDGRLRAFGACHAEVRSLASTGTLVRLTYSTDAHNLERVAAAITQLGARPRDIPAEWPFLPDALTLRAVPQLALHTSDGDLDLTPIV